MLDYYQRMKDTEGFDGFMLEVTDIAKEELTKVLTSENAKDRQLVIYFRGYG